MAENGKHRRAVLAVPHLPPSQFRRPGVTRAIAFVVLFALTNASLLCLFPFSLSRFFFVVVVYAAGTAVMLLGLFHPGNNWIATGQREVACGLGQCLALTFDDGPTPEITPLVLDVLRDKGVNATFFVIGRQVEQYPDLVRRAYEEGHRIANHTYSHPSLFCFLTPGRLGREIEGGQQSISSVIGTRPRQFRPPVGLKHPLLGRVLGHAGLQLVLWKIRTYDTRAVTAPELARRVLDRADPGAIVLLHDRPGPGAAAMVSALPGLIDALRARGFTLVAV